jgi:hypothetical protein
MLSILPACDKITQPDDSLDGIGIGVPEVGAGQILW